MKIKQLLVLGVCSLIILNGCGVNNKDIEGHRNNKDKDVNITVDVEDDSNNKEDNNDDDKTDDQSEDSSSEDDGQEFLTSLPESITGRGIIIPGAEPTKYNWVEYYTTDCNIKIDSNDDEFIKFVDELFDDYAVEKHEDKIFCVGGRDRYPVTLSSGMEDYTHFVLYRTRDGWEECEHGYRFVEDDPGYEENLYYDASGKYMLATVATSLSEPTMIAFLEPEVVEIMVYDKDGKVQADYKDDDSIQKVKDAFHEMDATWISAEDVKGDIQEAIESDDSITIVTTNEYDVTNEYTFIDGKYLIKDNEVYSLSNTTEWEEIN